eukprot:Colp12_sorted_trinity150504_noHs@32499
MASVKQDSKVEDFAGDDPYAAVNELRDKNESLDKENAMLEKFLKRVEPQQKGANKAGQPWYFTRKPNERPLKLTYEQKCDIAQRELEELKEEKEKATEMFERQIDNLKAEMEEATLRFSELKKASYEFKRDIVQGAINTRTGKVIAEKVMRYYEDKLRAKDTLIGKLRLKNLTLKVQKKKLRLQLKQKEEMGEVLHAIDFDQLKIENKQYLEKIDERNKELLKLKLTAGNTLLVLNTYKKKLNNLTMESEKLKGEIAQRQEMLAKLSAETSMVTSERDKAGATNSTLKHQLEDYKVPAVLEYVHEKAEQYELVKKVRSWERKVEIAELALKKHKKTWQQMCLSNQAQNPWAGMEHTAAGKVAMKT